MTTDNDMTGPELLEHIRSRMAELGMPDEPRVKQVRVSGVEAPLYVRTFSAEAHAALLTFGRAHPRDTPGKMGRLLAFGVCNADGGLFLSIEQAVDLPYDVAIELSEHVMAFNPTDDPE